MDITLIVKNFLKQRVSGRRPLLLALSGGADSLALFYSLLEVKDLFPFHVCHLDHGWREESKQEAEELQMLAANYHIPFYTKRLSNLPMANREEYCREQRLKFYQELSEKQPFQAILLAHHQDDQIETVLKRILEGARLDKLGGMQEEASYQSLTLWRPFLSLSKKTLVDFLERKKVSWFEDKTNRDPKYLRARMREEIIPFLTKSFGKKFTDNLLRLSKSSQQLQESLHSRLDQYLLENKGPFGTFFDLHFFKDLSSFDQEQALAKIFEKVDLPIRHKFLQNLLLAFKDEGSEKKYFLEKTLIIIDRQKIFFLKQFPLNFPSELSFASGASVKWDNGLIIENRQQASRRQTWEALWKGKVELSLLEGKYELALLHKGEDKALLKRYSEQKVPAFLRHFVPVIKKEGQIVGDLLTDYHPNGRLNHNKRCSIIN